MFYGVDFFYGGHFYTTKIIFVNKSDLSGSFLWFRRDVLIVMRKKINKF